MDENKLREKNYLETFQVLSDLSLRNALREARKKGSKCSEYKPLVSSS